MGTPVLVLGLLSSRGVMAAVGTPPLGAYRLDCETPVQNTDALSRATPGAPVLGVVDGRMDWDFRRGAFVVGGVRQQQAT